MKRKSMVFISVLVVLQLCCSILWARPTTAYEAEMVVTGWLNADARPLGMALGRKVMTVETFTDDYGQPVYYIVYLQGPGSAGTEPSGFVIVPADDLAEPIIGFANDGTYDPSLDNPLGALVTNDLNGRIAAVRSTFSPLGIDLKAAVTETQSKWRDFISLAEARAGGFGLMGRSSISDVRVAPLLKTKWGQFYVCNKNCFNYYTPDNYPCGCVADNYPCGCVATNIAQLIHYHRHPAMGIGVDEFTIEVDDVEQTASTRGGDGNGGLYQWDLMVLKPGCDTTLEERQAIGALCYDAGVAVRSSYSDKGTGAGFWRASLALRRTFKCKNAVWAVNLDPTSEGFPNIGPGLNDMVNPNLDANNPVMLGIYNKRQKYGHGVLCDGYGYVSSTLYHHLNFGWDGFNNAWYNLPTIDSDRYSFNVVDECIYNILPSDSGEIISGRATDASGNPISGATAIARGAGGPYTAVTNSNGIYALVGVRPHSTYTVSLRKSGCHFTAPQVVTTEISRDLEPVSGNIWAIDFVDSCASALEDFETGDFSRVPWEHGRDASWTIASRQKYSGAYSARAGEIDHRESTTLKVTLDCASGNITFYCKVSSESDEDYFKFYIDGVRMGRWSGRKDWFLLSFGVTAGTRTFEWTYSKNGRRDRGDDTVWIDDIEFPIPITIKTASNPDPPDGAADVNPNTSLSWAEGPGAVTHDVYLDTDEAAVATATTSSGQFEGNQSGIAYTPGPLTLGTTHYWRVDEVDGSATHKGDVWSFTTSDFIVVDDFEHYDAGQNQIWYAWKDGRGYSTPDSPPYYPGNQTGSAVGDTKTASCTEEDIVGEGKQAMPYFYDNNKQGSLQYSEATFTLSSVRDWTKQDIETLSLWFRGNPAGFVEGPVGTYTMAATGSDIWDDDDEFRYAYKQLSGAGTIEAQVLSVEYTDPWAKAGVMIRETLEPGSKFAAVYITPGNGCSFQARTSTDENATSDSQIATNKQQAINAPYWVKLERDADDNFNGYYSSDGSRWQAMEWNPQTIPMNTDVYIGLALCSHDRDVTCVAEFSDVKTTGTVSPPTWTNEAIGVTMYSNEPEPMYVAVASSGGTPAIIYYDDPNATQISTWTEWNIPVTDFGNAGVILTDVETISIGFGDRNNPQAGGSGKVYFDDIRLYRP
jgi:hypothetical protein